ncbi:glycerol-3-phosphate dehydrogenase/oxidase [Nocardia farcinica]|uniref:glycerol-3-phosphate dehydrogenase/oxidase n=2 Tax=Nocardia farcinica TaxID=37329 RepID=UPI001895BBEB|nr:glycerol-3-phosphate dehydrogenase/oxidase [Nocardia farcinica]MBF6186257.1 glycerol-3-phosphate dehydrogenase/oxidase [Nocardia farcinica]MBF6313441.1 glycerol-3-phosphate dehydrogenase/oxidase [Nocardia farcinica]MBF6409088.1 glycerol-3-phosphate dehydrogenase/oxidase [Nocardia farcinica]UEX24121.1 glycerol-3-phosphate dehydrogenase/oxidase [Nocardia farcinica]
MTNHPDRYGNSALDAARRTRELHQLGDLGTVDVLVVGGGVTGAGAALDAASRGLRTVLVERHDLAWGTSRWSSKLVHGGLRYLAGGRVGIARESAIERGILLGTVAPHLVRPLPQLVPLLPGIGRAQQALIRAGFLAGDALRRSAGTPASTLPRARRVAAAEALRLAPTVRRAGLRGGLQAWDGQLVDDARLVVALARTAAAHGALVLTRVAAEAITGDSAVLRDTLTDETLTVSAKAVINATGVWADQLDPSISLRPSRGTHLVFAAEAFAGLSASLTVPVPGSVGRFVFAFPAAHNRVYLGLTDEDAPGPVPDEPQPTDAEVDFLLDTVNPALREPLTRADIRGRYAGLRPLLRTGDGNTADISREHAVLHSPSGVFTIVGGKLTTYRRMAQDVVDAAVRAYRLPAGPCRTHTLPLVGAVAGAARDRIAAPPLLVDRYGSEAPQILALGERDPALREPVAPGLDVTAAEFAFARSHEAALTPDDLLDRRTRIGLVAADRAAALAAATAAFEG